MEYIELLRNFKRKNNRKTIESGKLQEIIGKEYNEVCEIVRMLEAKGYLKTYGKNHNQRPKDYRLYDKYRIMIEDDEPLLPEEREVYLDEINFGLYSKFEKERYRNDIGLYLKHKEYLIKLSEYFKYNKEKLNTKISINERSFEIFQDEKFLKNQRGLANEIFNSIEIDIEILNFYNTPEPFFNFSIKSNTSNILIVENKDTFYTIRKLFMENKNTLFNISFSTVIYGEGKKIINSFDDIFENNSLRHLNNEDCKFYYWGDIDREGMWIYESLKEKYKLQNIQLLVQAYRRMIDETKDIKIRNNKKQQKMKPKNFDEFNSELAKYIEKLVYSDRYIPQEIISYRILRDD